jgi:hypothetical protein
MRISAFAKTAAEWLSGAFLVGSLATTVWAARRGWDFLDGGTYYLSYKFPADVVDIETSYQIPGGVMFRAVGENIFRFRVLSWLFVVGAAWVFYRGFRHQLQSFWPEETVLKSLRGVGVCLLLAGLAPFITAPAALTYNSLNAVCLLVALSLLLSATANVLRTGASDWRTRIKIAGACLVTGGQIFIKPPTSLFLFGAIFGFCLLSPFLPRQFKIWFIAVLVAIGFVGGALISGLFGSRSALTLRTTNLLLLSRNSAYTHELLNRIGKNLVDLGALVASDLRLPATVLVIAIVVISLNRRRTLGIRNLAACFGAAVFLSWLGVAIHERLWEAGYDYFARAALCRFYIEAALLSGAMAVLLACFVSVTSSLPATGAQITVHLALLWTMLMLIPFAGAFGTTNPIYLNAAFQAPFWMAAIALAVVSMARRCGNPSLVPIVLLPIAAFATAQFINGHVLHPYALRTDLFKQDTATTSRFITATRRILETNGFKPGDDIFAFFNLPGLVFAVGGRSPVIPWYFGRIYGGDKIEETYMLRAGDERRQHAWIITQADATLFKEHYRRGGLDFPDHYTIIGELTNPSTAMDIKIWKVQQTVK